MCIYLILLADVVFCLLHQLIGDTILEIKHSLTEDLVLYDESEVKLIPFIYSLYKIHIVSPNNS